MHDLLPNSLRDIAEAIGYENTIKIVEGYAGAKIWIPRQPTLDWALLPILGYENAYKLAKLCGGSQIEIPICRAIRMGDRNEKIKGDRATHTIAQLSAKYRLCRWQIHQILKK